MFPILLITAFIYINSDNSLKNESKQSSLSEIHRIRDTAEMLLTFAKNTAIKTATQDNTQIFFYAKDFSNISSNVVSDIKAFQKNFTYINTYIDSCFMYSENNGYIISTEGTVSADKFSDKSFSDFIKYNKKNYLLTIIPSEKFDFKYVSLIPEDYFKINTTSIWFTVFTALVITLFACIILTIIITVKNYKPLQNIISIIEKPENYIEPKIGNTNQRIKLIFGNAYGIYFDETQSVGTTVNILIPNIKTLE